MALNENQRNIKRAQKEAQLLRELSTLILNISLDEPTLAGLYISHIKLSPDKSRCMVYMSGPTKEQFEKILSTLILYKPSIRSSIAKNLQARYTPELVFVYDDLTEKKHRIEELLNKVTSEPKNDDGNS